MARKQWDQLSDGYRERLISSGAHRGLSPDEVQARHAAGESLAALRGHERTPERPERAIRDPQRFGDYLAARGITPAEPAREERPELRGDVPRAWESGAPTQYDAIRVIYSANNPRYITIDSGGNVNATYLSSVFEAEAIYEWLIDEYPDVELGEYE